MDLSLTTLAIRVDQLRQQVLDFAARHEHRLVELAPEFRDSAVNLLHYLSLRSVDLRTLQDELSQHGLSSLGRIEAQTLASLNAVVDVLNQLAADRVVPPTVTSPVRGQEFRRGRQLLEEHATALFGPVPKGRNTRMMVTLAGELADEPAAIRDLLSAGMNCARINCAHDDLAVWQRLVDGVRAAERDTGHHCRIAFDLAGPKLRTGPIAAEPGVISWHPQRDRRGVVIQPALLWLAHESRPSPLREATHLPIDEDWLEPLSSGSELTLRDTRGKTRHIELLERHDRGWLARSYETGFVENGTTIFFRERHWRTVIQGLPPAEIPLTLRQGDDLILTRDPIPGQPRRLDAQGRLVSSARISCTLPEVFADAVAGQPILFDDGKIGGVIRAVSPTELVVEITRTRPNGARLRSDKGINLPETELRIPGLTPRDLADLDFVAQHADMVNLSFANDRDDILSLQQALQARGRPDVGIVLKIESQRGFRNLPALLLAGMRWSPFGVMIARGDLAIECGWERLSELQEEILWLCEAAHVPAIWATQVLEGLAHDGLPTRAEITDAAMGQRAECVMLNKGRHLLAAMQTLHEILARMDQHQRKKFTRLRLLRVSESLL